MFVVKLFYIYIPSTLYNKTVTTKNHLKCVSLKIEKKCDYSMQLTNANSESFCTNMFI